MFNTQDAVDGQWTTGPSYVVAGWTSASARAVPDGCTLWPGPSGGTLQTCPASGAVTAVAYGASGAPTWYRSLPAVRGVSQAGPQPDGRTSLVAYGCATAGSACDTFDLVALRFGPTGTIERNYVGRFIDSSTGRKEFVWEEPVALTNGSQAVTIDARPAGSDLNNNVITKLLGGPTAPK